MDIPIQLTHSLIALFDGGYIVVVVVGMAKAFEWFDGMVSHPSRCLHTSAYFLLFVWSFSDCNLS
jgi:hypothetical protein